jgi:hypothetical protein
MTTTRDEESRASAYIASNKPLFQARNLERKFFTRTRVPVEGPLLSPEDSPASRIPLPRKTSLPRATTSLRDAYEQATREEEQGLVPGTGRARSAEIEGSPSPAPRPRPVGSSQREKDEARMRRLREGMAAAIGGPFDQNGAADPVSPLEDDNTVRTSGSGTEGSVSGSGVSPEEDTTDDDLHRKMRQYARDQQRAAAALNSQNGLFTRGGVGTRVSETAQTLVRKSSVSSLESEPGVRLPKTWGRHAKTKTGWLSRILSPDNSEEVHDLSPQVVSEGSIDWAGAAVDVPLPSVEDGSSIQEPTPPHSRPNSAQPRNTSPQKSHIWDPEFDFTAQSVQESTSPLLKIKNTKLDEIRAREIEALSRRAVATSRLEEIKERNSEDRSVSPEATRSAVKDIVERRPSENADRWVRQRFRSLSDAAEASEDETPARTASTDVVSEKEDIKESVTKALDEAQPMATSTSKAISSEARESGAKEVDVKANFVNETYLQDYSYEKTILEEEGEAIPGTPITIFKGAAAKEKKPSQLGHSRDDSWENLKKLARLTSATPSPASIKLAERSSDESLKQLNRLSADIKRLSGASTPPKSDVDPEERIVSEVSLFELPDNKSERNSLRTPSPPGDGSVDETPRPKADPLSLPTPVVTGAYIDTPAPRGRQPKIGQPSTGDALHDEVSRLAIKDFIRGSRSHSRTSQKDARTTQRGTEHGASRLSSNSAAQSPKPKPRQRSRPSLFNSANPASVEDDLRAIQQEAEDSTLDDFDGLLTAEAEDLDLNSTTIMETLIDLEKNDKGQPLSAEERERRQEMLAIERMNKTIKSGLVSIRDAKRGIERLEDQVSSTPEPLKHNHDHDSCPKCTSQKSTHHVNLTIPVPRLWSRDPTKWTGVRFTWLGLLLALFITWFCMESVTCEFICHPQYASTNNWHPDDPFWGWALPTLLDRCTAGLLKFSLKFYMRLLLWVWTSWTGSEVGFGTNGRRSRPMIPTKNPNMYGDLGGVWSEGSMFEDEAI